MLELLSDLPADIKVTPKYLEKPPEPVLRLLAYLIEALDKFRKRNDELEAKIGRNSSSNSNKLPSTDSPLVLVKAKGKTKGRPGAKVGHVGHRQAMLPPTRTLEPSPYVRRLQSEMENFRLFLRQEGEPATNYHAERLLRFAVL